VESVSLTLIESDYGAHLASGTTVMHEGFVNFNAGTLGSSMVEGLNLGWRRRR